MTDQPKFDEKGILPAIIQDARSGRVLMLGYMNAESYQRTLSSGQVWFYSRSRQELWHKGATSGSYLDVVRAFLDCDSDTILIQVEPQGPVCHTGSQSCFFQEVEGLSKEEGQDAGDPAIVGELFNVILERKRTMPEGSYTRYLFEHGVDKIGKKVIEEAGESVIAAKNGEPGPIAAEVADLWYHSLVLLAATGLTPEDVFRELQKRRK